MSRSEPTEYFRSLLNVYRSSFLPTCFNYWIQANIELLTQLVENNLFPYAASSVPQHRWNVSWKSANRPSQWGWCSLSSIVLSSLNKVSHLLLEKINTIIQGIFWVRKASLFSLIPTMAFWTSPALSHFTPDHSESRGSYLSEPDLPSTFTCQLHIAPLAQRVLIISACYDQPGSFWRSISYAS